MVVTATTPWLFLPPRATWLNYLNRIPQNTSRHFSQPVGTSLTLQEARTLSLARLARDKEKGLGDASGTGCIWALSSRQPVSFTLFANSYWRLGGEYIHSKRGVNKQVLCVYVSVGIYTLHTWHMYAKKIQDRSMAAVGCLFTCSIIFIFKTGSHCVVLADSQASEVKWSPWLSFLSIGDSESVSLYLNEVHLFLVRLIYFEPFPLPSLSSYTHSLIPFS